MNLIVTAREPGTDATSNGSSLILRTIRPNAYISVPVLALPSATNIELTLATASRAPETVKIRSGLPLITSETVTRALDFS